MSEIQIQLVNYESITKPDLGEPGMMVNFTQENAVALFVDLWHAIGHGGQEWALSILDLNRRRR